MRQQNADNSRHPVAAGAEPGTELMTASTKNTALHWASVHEFGFVAGMKLLFWLYKKIGRWPFRLILYPVLFWYLLFRPSARHASQIYLRHVNRRQAIRTDLVKVIAHFAAFAEMMLDKMLLWSGSVDPASICTAGTELIEQLIAEKRGAVFICSHLGNADFSRILSGNHRSQITILAHTKHARMFNQLLSAMNPLSQLNVVQVTEMTPDTAMMLATKVADGEFIMIAGDRIPVAPEPRVVMAEFLGEPAPFPVGPYVLASVLQCPLYMLFSAKIADRVVVQVELLRESVRLPRNNRDEQLVRLVADYARHLESHCLQSPLQWFNFYDYWQLPAFDPASADGRGNK